MLDGSSTSGAVVAFAAAVIVSAMTTPVGVSGAVFLLPVQVSVLGVPSPAVTPTNLLFNIFATPSAVIRYARQGQLDAALARLLLAGTVPGVVLGAWVRVTYLPGADVLRILLTLLLGSLGVWLLVGSRRRERPPKSAPPTPLVVGLAVIVGVFGGLVGIGGGSILAPVLAVGGMAMSRVAPAALLTTFVTSVVGLATFVVLAQNQHAAAAPEWVIGIALGLGGVLGGYCGARLQPRLREEVLRRVLGGVALFVAVMYVLQTLA